MSHSIGNRKLQIVLCGENDSILKEFIITENEVMRNPDGMFMGIVRRNKDGAIIETIWFGRSVYISVTYAEKES